MVGRLIARRFVVCVAAFGLVAVVSRAADLVGLALEGAWERLVADAQRRQSQIELRPEEAMVAALAARRVDRPDLVRGFLETAIEGGPLSGLAHVELAQELVRDDPARAVELAGPWLTRSSPPELRESAVDTVSLALETGVEDGVRRAAERATTHLSRNDRRKLELALALTDVNDARARTDLRRLLDAEDGDSVALEAAERLLLFSDLDPRHVWLIGRTLFRHALYDRAAPLLEASVTAADRGVPSWEAAFLRGRCDFRLGRFTQASSWYLEARRRASGSERVADLEVHLARALELAGDSDGAVEAARRAVVRRPNDDRRLLLIRLRLVRGEQDLAVVGLRQIKGRVATDRGRLLMGLDRLAQGDDEGATTWLGLIRNRPWRDPATVLLARIEVEHGRSGSALERLEAASVSLGGFWSQRGREIVARIDPEVVDPWRIGMRRRIEAASRDADQISLLASWSAIEPDAGVLEELRSRYLAITTASPSAPPTFPPGLARELWFRGLDAEAVRWHPQGLPTGSTDDLLWSATWLSRLGRPDRGLRLADRAWRSAGAGLPVRIHRRQLRRLLFPLPFADEMQRAVGDGPVPWSLVAAVAREESRWNPEAVSSVGARGLMQLMPATAAELSTRLEQATGAPTDLFDPSVALRLGTAELHRLLDEFDGFTPAVVAAYNAGEAQARLWLDQCGTGCDETSYVAAISFGATRSYTADVLWAASMYRELDGESKLVVTARTP